MCLYIRILCAQTSRTKICNLQVPEIFKRHLGVNKKDVAQNNNSNNKCKSKI